MDVDELLDRAQETLSGKRVYGEAIERDGITVIPAAEVAGGGGGGGGQDEEGQEGLGGGFGLRARPAGVFAIVGDDVRWRPAVDVNRLVATIGWVAVAVLFVRWRTAALTARRAERVARAEAAAAQATAAEAAADGG